MASRKRTFLEACIDGYKLIDSNKDSRNSCKLMKLQNVTKNGICRVNDVVVQCDKETDEDDNGNNPKTIRDDEIVKLHNQYPQVIMDFNYALDVCILCLLRKSMLLHKYPTLNIDFQGAVVSGFGKIVLGHIIFTYQRRNTLIQIEQKDTYYQVDSINYTKLFSKHTDSFSIQRYYNSFVRYICRQTRIIDAIKNIDYLVIYTNAGLELTTGLRFKKGRFQNFFPFKLAPLDFTKKQCELLKDILYTDKSIEGRDFYKFVLEGDSKEEFLKYLILSPFTLAELKRAKLNEHFEQMIKDVFLNKLVFAVKQPNREELNSIVKEEIKQYNQAQEDYLVLKKLVLKNKDGKIEKDGLQMGSDSNILKNTRGNAEDNVGVAFMWCLHSLFLHKNIKALQIVEGATAGLLNLLLTYKQRNIYISFESTNDMNLSDSNHHSFKEISKHLSRLFEFFVDSNNCEISYFVIYTELVELNDSLCLKSINKKKKKYKFLEHCGFICPNSVYKLVEENDVVAEFIKFPKSLKRAQESGEISVECIQEMKSRFLSKLVFALSQPSNQVLKQNLMTEVKRANHSKSVPYTYSELEVVSHRVLELYSAEPITKSCLDTLLQDMKEIEIKNQFKIARNIIKEHNLFSHLSKDQHNYFVVRLFNQLKQSSKAQTSVSAQNKSLTEANQLNYLSLQAHVMRCLTTSQGKRTSLIEDLSITIYEQNLILAALHTLYTHKHMLTVSFIENRCAQLSRSNLVLNYRNRLTYIRPHQSSNSIVYSQLFPKKKACSKGTFALNEYFATYLETMERHMPLRYFVVYTNAGLVLNAQLKLKNELDKGAFILQFQQLDAGKNKYKVFSACSFIDTQHLYQFSKEEEEDTLNILLNALELGEYEKSYSSEEALVLKKDFIKKLIFAVRQPCQKILHGEIYDKVTAAKASQIVPYNFEDFLELSLRWLECHISGSMTKSHMIVLLRDINIKKSSAREFDIANIRKVISFVKAIAGKEGSYAYEQLLSCLIHEGRLKILERHNVSLSAFSSIMSNNLLKRSTSTFKGIFDLWFDAKGNKTRYLTLLEENNIKLRHMTTMLSNSSSSAVEAFKELFNLFFDSEGNKTRYLTVLEKKKMKFRNMSSILNSSNRRATEAYVDLFNLWFDAAGNKTKYLESLEINNVKLESMCCLLGGSGSKSASTFKELYNLWFDEAGNKSNYLQTLEKEGIKLSNITGILTQCNKKAPKAFKSFFRIWFDSEGNKTRYLKLIEREGIEVSSVSSLLKCVGLKAKQTFKELCRLWFDKDGNVTRYLDILKKEGLNFSVMIAMIHGAGRDVPKLYKAIIDMWFKSNGDKRRCIRRLESHGITIVHISYILTEAARNADKAFKQLYHAFIDDDGGKQPFLSHFLEQENEEERFTINDLANILYCIGPKPRLAFEQFHNICYNSEGKPTPLLRDLYSLGLKPRYLTMILHGQGSLAAANMKLLHNFYFASKKQMSEKTTKLNVIERKAKLISESLSKNENVGNKKYKNFFNIGSTLGKCDALIKNS